MNIRLANTNDMDAIMNIYCIAREFMQNSGNKNQWINGYPQKELISKNIQEFNHYVCICNNQISGTFYFKIEDDITYAKIYDGKWLNDKPYGVIHRLASNGLHKGIGHFCMEWCFEQHHNIRVDTHRENIVMQNILKKEGYLQCGTILIQNGTERIAFQKTLIN